MNNTSIISDTPSRIWLPEAEWQTVLDFFCDNFAVITREQWISRMNRGLVSFEGGELITPDTPYKPSSRVFYFRELKEERHIPFEEKIVFENENILIADKPHFLPVHPAGNYINETLLNRLKKSTGIAELNHAHRIDRLTAGLLLFTKKKEIRSDYQKMFEQNKIHKTYKAIGKAIDGDLTEWHVKNRLSSVYSWFMMKNDEGTANSETFIKKIDRKNNRELFELKPITGKKHQLRLHMCLIGNGILNDPLYPIRLDHAEENFENPLQLLAWKLAFKDPLSGEEMEFKSSFKLSF